MKRFEFTITLSGQGETIQEAWEDAVAQFSPDPGNHPLEDGPDVQVIEEQ